MKKVIILCLAGFILVAGSFMNLSEAKSTDKEISSVGTHRKSEETFNMTLDELMKSSTFPVGGENVKYAQYFEGTSYLKMLSLNQVIVGNVTFSPGCRNHWHIHHATKGGGQMLLITAGRGYYQEWGKPVQELHPGDVVNIPAETKHWHGAAPNSAFQHLAIEVPGENASTEWCEPVDDEEYRNLK